LAKEPVTWRCVLRGVLEGAKREEVAVGSEHASRQRTWGAVHGWQRHIAVSRPTWGCVVVTPVISQPKYIAACSQPECIAACGGRYGNARVGTALQPRRGDVRAVCLVFDSKMHLLERLRFCNDVDFRPQAADASEEAKK
jgi:hypothetical protein